MRIDLLTARRRGVFSCAAALGLLLSFSSAARFAFAAENTNRNEDTFSRANQTGWSTSINGDGISNFTWQGDVAANTSTSINGDSGQINYPGSTLYTLRGYLGHTQMAGDMLFQFSFSSVGTTIGGAQAVGYLNACGVRTLPNGCPVVMNNGGVYGYSIVLDGYNGIIELVMNNGTWNVLSSSSFTFTAGVNYDVRFNVTGGASQTVQAKVWNNTQGEPSGWTLTASDQTYLSGYAGVAARWVAQPSAGTADKVNFHVTSLGSPQYPAAWPAFPVAEASDDNFARANQTDWGTSTNNDGVANAAWQGDVLNNTSTSITGDSAYINFPNTTAYTLRGYLGNSQTGGDLLFQCAFNSVGAAQAIGYLDAASYAKNNGSLNAYSVVLDTTTNIVEIVRNSGSWNTLASASFTFNYAVRYNVRLHVGGTPQSVSARIWADGSKECSATIRSLG